LVFNVGAPDIGTPNSNSGQFFVSDPMDRDASAQYFGLVNASFADLFWDLEVNFVGSLAIAEEFTYFADTYKVQVSAPTSIAFTLAGLALFMRRHSRNIIK
jgi:hypothetical protein